MTRHPGVDISAVEWFDADPENSIESIDRITEPRIFDGNHNPYVERRVPVNDIRAATYHVGCGCGLVRPSLPNAGLATIASNRHRRETAKKCYKCKHSRFDHCWAADRDGSRWWACMVGKCNFSIRRRWP